MGASSPFQNYFPEEGFAMNDDFVFVKNNMGYPIPKNKVESIYYDGNKIDSISNETLREFNSDLYNEHVLQFQLIPGAFISNPVTGEKIEESLFRFESGTFKIEGRSIL